VIFPRFIFDGDWIYFNLILSRKMNSNVNTKKKIS
jgi:hypothetical protein